VEGANGAPPLLDEVASAVGTMHGKLAEAAASADPKAAFAKMGDVGAGAVKVATQKLPGPLKQAFEKLANDAQGRSTSSIRDKINEAWRTDVLPFCHDAINGRFPFAPGSAIDTNFDDLTHLFAAGGLIDTFVKGQLAPYVNTEHTPWTETQGVGLAPGALAQLARVRKITMTLFASGAGPKASFTLKPVALDGGGASATLSIDGKDFTYANGPQSPQPFSWPGPNGTNLVSLSFAPANGSAPIPVAQKEGPWALFRLFHEGRVEPTGQPEIINVSVGGSGYTLRMQLRSASAENPFNLQVFSGFACPEGF
jgi:type VI secretion system protein ImpL